VSPGCLLFQFGIVEAIEIILSGRFDVFDLTTLSAARAGIYFFSA